MRFFIFAFSLFLFVFTITAQTDSINSLFDVAIEVDSGITDSIQTIQDNNIDKDSDKAKESSTSIGLTIFTISLTFLTIVSSVVIFLFQRAKWRDEAFLTYTNNLHSNIETIRVASAISLRSFISYRYYKIKTIRTIVGLLRVLPNSSFQKILGDSFSDEKNIIVKDFQGVNFFNVLIKPRFLIEHNLKNKSKELVKYLGMQAVDFFKANLTQFNATNVDFTEAAFMNTRMCSARFKKCILTKGDFRYADLDGAKFVDCYLDGANFKFARRIDKVVIIKTSVIGGEIKEDKFSLIEFLDKDGKFSSERHNPIVYSPKEENKRIFVSKLGAMNSYQQMCYDRILQYISDKYKVKIVTLEREDYRKFGQLSTIKDAMSDCSGVLVFAFKHMDIGCAVVRDGLKQPEKEYKENCSYTSPWIQIETAFANSLNIPTLIFMEDGVAEDGIFDDMIIKVDQDLFKTTYAGGLTDDNIHVIVDWYDSVELYELQK